MQNKILDALGKLAVTLSIAGAVGTGVIVGGLLIYDEDSPPKKRKSNHAGSKAR